MLFWMTFQDFEMFSLLLRTILTDRAILLNGWTNYDFHLRRLMENWPRRAQQRTGLEFLHPSERTWKLSENWAHQLLQHSFFSRASLAAEAVGIGEFNAESLRAHFSEVFACYCGREPYWRIGHGSIGAHSYRAFICFYVGA